MIVFVNDAHFLSNASQCDVRFLQFLATAFGVPVVGPANLTFYPK